MGVLLSVLTILTFVGIYFLVGIYASRYVSSASDYFVAGRSLGIATVTFSLIATQLGGGMITGTSGEAYLYGFYGLFYTLSMAIGFLILAGGLARVLQRLNISTTAELFETRYGSVSLKKFASLLSVISLSGLLIGQIVASRGVILGWLGNSEIALAGIWLSLITYTMIGGLYAVVMTDIYQVLVIVAVFSAIFLYCLLVEPSWFASFPSLGFIQKSHFTDKSIWDTRLLGVIVMPALFSLIEQDLAQRFFAARSRTVATLSALFAGIFLVAFAMIPVYLGMQARLTGIDLPITQAMMGYLSNVTCDFVVLLAACALMAAFTSTADSLLCAISSNVAQDFDISGMLGRFGLKDKLSVAKLVTFCIGMIALIASYFVPQNVIDILKESYALSVNALLVPLLFAYFSTNVKKEAAVAAIVAGLGTYALMPFWNTGLPKAIIPLLASFIAYGIGHFHAAKK